MADIHWANLQQIFHAALSLAPNEREAYLDSACSGDASLRRSVEALLKSHNDTDNFIDAPAYQVAAEMLVRDTGLTPGQEVGHYRIVSLIGEGGMGRVYLAEDLKLHRRVALKFLSKALTQDPERLQRFQHEARAASALNHPNILTIHEIGEAKGYPFIAIEFIEGQTLRECLRAPIHIEDALEIAIQIASAMVAAHRAHIVHRDIKPENVMVRHDDRLVKVLDFGLAKISPAAVDGETVNHEAPTQFKTGAGVVMGTVAYMSPEQARGDTVDARTDIWSLGVVLYEMIAGHSPFIAGTTNEIISAILARAPAPRLARYVPEVPERLEEIVGKALAKNKNDRYQTSHDLLTDLKRLQQSLQIDAGLESSRSADTASPSRNEAARVATTNISAATPTSSAEYIVGQLKAHKRGAIGIALVALMAIAIAIVSYNWRTKQTAATAAGAPQIKSLAVLPLKSLDSGENYLGVGIADAVIRSISRTGRLTVRPTTAVLKYVKEDTDSLTAARQLTADAILEGTVQRSGDRLRVTVNLLRASDGASLWADNFDLTTNDIFAIEDRVAQQVVARLQLRLDANQQAALNRNYPTSPSAYEAYIKGIFNLDQRGYEEESMPQMQNTIDFFKKSIDADPNYALAHAQLAWAYVWTAEFIEPAESKWVDLARQEIKRADELDSNLAETHLAKAMLFWSKYENYQNDAALRELRIAQQLNPNISHGELAGILGHVGLDEQASSELNHALEIDPTSQSLTSLKTILPFLRGDADAWLDGRQKPSSGRSYFDPWYYLRKGQLDAAKKAIDERPEGLAYPDFLMLRALYFALKGDHQEAESQVSGILGKVVLGNESRHHITYNAACIYALGGNAAEAVKWLKETAATGFPNYPLFARDPFLNRIRQAPEFIQFMDEQKAQWEKLRAEFGN